jgi:hypothetical protein
LPPFLVPFTFFQPDFQVKKLLELASSPTLVLPPGTPNLLSYPLTLVLAYTEIRHFLFLF